MKELGWRQESLTNSSSRPPIEIRSTRSDHMIKELFMKKKKFQPISIFLMIRKRLIRALEGLRDKGDHGIKVDVPDFHGRLHPEDFLDWLSSVEKFFDWKELSEVCEGEIPEHGSCLNLVGSSPSKA